MTTLTTPPAPVATEPDDLESRTREIGRAVFARVRRAGDSSGEPWWDRWLMQQGMRDEAVKAQLFRFIDVLPALASPAAGERPPPRVPADRPRPAARRRSAGRSRWLPGGGGWLGKPLARTGQVQRPADGPAVHRRRRPARGHRRRRALRQRHLAFTIDLLGEAVLSGGRGRRATSGSTSS